MSLTFNNKLEIMSIYKDINAKARGIRNQNENDKIFKLLDKYIESNSFSNEIINIIKTKLVKQDYYKNNKADISSYVKNTDCNKLNNIQWKSLCFIANLVGMHRIGYDLKQKAVEYLYDKGVKNKNIKETCELFSAAMEQGDFATARHIIHKKFRIVKEFNKSVKRAQLFLHIVGG